MNKHLSIDQMEKKTTRRKSQVRT